MEARANEIYACWVRPASDAPSPAGIPPSATRFAEVDGPTRLLLSTARPPDADGWTEFRLRHTHAPNVQPDPTVGPYLLAVRIIAAAGERAEFRRWLHEEHARLQVSLEGVNWYLGYEEEGAHHSFLNMWGIDAPAIVDGGAWAAIRDTPWWRRVSHVTAGAERGVYRPD